MPHSQLAANPFALMMDPDAIFAAIERSERLACLKSRICRPLDEPRVAGCAEANAFEETIESTEIAEPSGDAADETDVGAGVSCFADAPTITT